MWSWQIWYDYYMFVFVYLGEQVILNKEIYVIGDVVDDEVFGYQECWVEYCYYFSMIIGLFCFMIFGMIDGWYLV